MGSGLTPRQRRRSSRRRKLYRWVREAPARWRVGGHLGGFAALPGRPKRRYVPLPDRVWSTKSHDWWVLLAAMLKRFEPGSILELGSGRSSIYLSEYACKRGKALVSIDESAEWVAVVRMIARFGGLRDDFVHHVPLAGDGYYDVAELERLVAEPPDFLYLDGPVGSRAALLDHPALVELCSQADVIVIDDVQWPEVYDQMEALQDTGKKRRRTLIEYTIPEDPHRFLGVLVRDDLQPTLDELIRCLGIDTVDDYPRSRCVQR